MTPKERAPAQKAAKDMRVHILTTASHLMLEKGVRATSINDIAQAAGISKGTLYYYYSAKDDIVYDIADRNLTQITEEFMAWLSQMEQKHSPVVILKALFHRVLGAQDRGRLHLYLLSDALINNQELAAKFKRRYDDCLTALKVALDTVTGPKETNQAMAHLLLAALDGLAVQKMCGTENIPVEEIVGLLFASIECEQETQEQY